MMKEKEKRKNWNEIKFVVVVVAYLISFTIIMASGVCVCVCVSSDGGVVSSRGSEIVFLSLSYLCQVGSVPMMAATDTRAPSLYNQEDNTISQMSTKGKTEKSTEFFTSTHPPTTYQPVDILNHFFFFISGC